MVLFFQNFFKEILIALFIVVHSIKSISNSNSTCPLFVCSQDQTTPQLQCMNATNEGNTIKYVFTKCQEEGYYCNFDPLKNYTVGESALCTPLPNPFFNLLDGQYCNEDAECLNSKCKKHKCKGLTNSQACPETKYCAAGLYCSSNKICIPLISNSTIHCNNDYECSNYLVCDNGFCKQPYLLPDGSVSDNPRMCASNLLTLNDDKTICDRLTLLEDNYECKENQDFCRYRYEFTKQTITQQCVCAMTSTQHRRCPPDSNPEIMSDQAFSLSVFEQAHTLLRAYNNWQGPVYNQVHPNKDMDKCVANVLNSTQYLKMLNLVFLLLGIILVF